MPPFSRVKLPWERSPQLVDRMAAWSIKITKTGVLDLNEESQTYKGNRSTKEEPSHPQSMKSSRNECLFKPRSPGVTKSRKQSQVLCLSVMLDVPYESLLNYKATSLPYSNGPESILQISARICVREVMGSKREYGFKGSVEHRKQTIKTVAQDPKIQPVTYAGIRTGLGLEPAPNSIQIKGSPEPHREMNTTNKVVEVSTELLRAASPKGGRYRKPVFSLRSKVTGPVGAANIASSASFELPKSVIHSCGTHKGTKGLLSKEGICPWGSNVMVDRIRELDCGLPQRVAWSRYEAYHHPTDGVVGLPSTRDVLSTTQGAPALEY
ncbi:hypothetical protein BS47DRAFT_1368931 [Hydnum rufescens UP504]|uniref:Uncharacterized protein n=1 Tax=Hydnum rufescens UP504 TaxID=1448309 RepID=A0A9P6AEG2_9AGAM|nr:hypothetical protein BS47DRAFT_1368931 [Hydnum rufescens UP504]